jgi:predicted membrane metal-binding protein
MAGHETLKSNRKVELGSNRNFGLVFAGVFTVLAVWPLIRHGEAIRWWALAPAAVFLGLALYADHLLAPLNKLWFRFGLLLHSIVSPLVMGALFYGAVTPVALVLRAMGKDILRLKQDDAKSYWLERTPPGPAKNSMGQQF